MVTCGHQFRAGDEGDWLISSSAVRPINGNTSATKILQNLIEAHCKTRRDESRKVFRDFRENKSDSDKLDWSFYLQSECSEGNHSAGEELDLRKAPAFILEAREIQLATPRVRKTATYRAEKEDYTENRCSSDDLDESQHVDDCPIKWYCRRRTKSGWGPCVALRRHAEDSRGQSGKKFRDRIPLEVKIGKISLNKRDNELRLLRRHERQTETETYKKFEIDPKVVEMQKKRLEAKLNWRPFQDNEDEEESDLSQDFNSRDGYLRPRSAIGGKAPVSILLFPYHQQSNCSCGKSTEKAPKVTSERVSSAVHSVTPSIPMEMPRSTKIPRPKTIQTLRWGSKPQKRGKSLQLPKQKNVLFDAPVKRLSNNPPGVRKHGEKAAKTLRRSGEDARKAQSLTSLYYELEDKSNSGRLIDDEYLERMIRELSMEDNLRGIRNILNPGFPAKKKRVKEESHSRECHHRVPSWSDDDRFKIICKQVKFSQRRPKSRMLNCNQTEVYVKPWTAGDILMDIPKKQGGVALLPTKTAPLQQGPA